MQLEFNFITLTQQTLLFTFPGMKQAIVFEIPS